MDERIFVRYCLTGHEIRFSGICPSVCSLCGNRVDLSRPPVPLEELSAPEQRERQAPVQPVSAPAAPPCQEVRPVTTPVLPPCQETRPTPTRPVIASAVPPRQEARPIPVRVPGRIPAEEKAAEHPVAAQPLKEQKVGLRLNYFGMSLSVPPQGAVLGREGLGAEWFQGNRLISRRHARIRPDQVGRLIVEDDNSLNGVFYDKGQGRVRLEKDRSVLLEPGNVLWLYNLPITVEVDTHAV